jgi:hypothetical protein
MNKRFQLQCITAFTSLWLTACGAEVARHQRADAPELPWSTRFCHDDPSASAGEAFTLRQSHGTWELGHGDPNSDPSLEQVRINEASRSVCLDVPPPPSNKNGGMCLMTVRDGSNQGVREGWGYIACNSELVGCKGSWADFTLVVPLINAIGLGHVCEPFVRHDDLWNAVQSSGSFQALARRLAKRQDEEVQRKAEAQRTLERQEAERVAAAHRAEEQRRAMLEAYRRERSQADSVYALANFIERYREHDPDQLVPSARIELQGRLRDFQSGLDAGAQTHCGLVVQVRRSEQGVAIAVETQVVGVHWFEPIDLLPSGLAECRFVNNTYLHPSGFGYL